MKLNVQSLLAAAAAVCVCGSAATAQEQPAQPPVQASPENNPPPQVAPPEPHAVEMLRREASQLIRIIKTPEAQRFLIATSWLPVFDDRTLYVNKQEKKVIAKGAYEALPEEQKKTYEPRVSTPKEYYYTRYGTPLAYARPLDLYVGLQEKDFAFAGKKVLDFGYGTIGHLRLLASLGAECVGVDVDPILPALYADPEDTGPIDGALMTPPMPAGKLALVCGRWPAEAETVEKVGGGYDLIISKNTLKNGYINPEEKVDPRMLVNLGVGNSEFVKAAAGALKSGGYFVIYNICPAQKPKGEGYIPWADGRCPFPKEMLEAAGFEVVKFDEDDTQTCRDMGRRLGWDTGNNPMDVETDLFAHYTILRKK